MDQFETEIRYLCVEANKIYNFLSTIKNNSGETIVVPNLSYGLVAISPIFSLLRSNNYPIHSFKIGSSESHGNPLVIDSCIPLDRISQGVQPNFVVIDGTRNVGGNDSASNKYPDSQQGYLNYTIALNDFITSNEDKSFRNLMGVSSEHIKRLRDTGKYEAHRRRLEEKLGSSKPSVPYSFKYWNPAETTLAIYNPGEGCDKSTKSFSLDKLVSKLPPTIFFVNSVMLNKHHSSEHRKLWGKHRPAYFDDDTQAKDFQFEFDNCGVFLTSGLGVKTRLIYEELYGGKNDQTN